MQSTKDSTATIANSFTITEEGTVLFVNKAIENNFFANAANRKAEIIETISNLIYQNFYCAVPALSDGKTNSITEIASQQFKKLLLKEYNPPATFNKGWRLIEKENNGIAYFQKQNEVIRLNPGQFVEEFDQTDERYQFANYYSVLNPPLHFSDDGYFHFVNGAMPYIGNDNPLIRFYFHLQPEGAPVLIKLVTYYFNLFKIPFSFKCCANPKDFTRSDSAVLYFANHFFSISIQLLEKIISEMKMYLKKENPLFALRLCDGFSFAENPHNSLSFGQSRCNIIAEGIYECMVQKIDSEKHNDFIIEKIKAAGYNLNAMHLNPNATYPYDFSLALFQ